MKFSYNELTAQTVQTLIWKWQDKENIIIIF